MAVTPRFRMVAGPNGSGKTTLWRWLAHAYAVNFYTFINADDMFAEATARGFLRAPLPIDGASLDRFVAGSGYPDEVQRPFRDGRIALSGDCFRFVDGKTATTYTVSLLANFFQSRMIEAGTSFSQETVFSHPGKVEALKKAQTRGFRTYLYFVATDNPAVNVGRVRQRAKAGGHDVPVGKIVDRYHRSLGQIASALPWVSRAYFFDNSGSTMRFLAEYGEGADLRLAVPLETVPGWFRSFVLETTRDGGGR